MPGLDHFLFSTGCTAPPPPPPLSFSLHSESFTTIRMMMQVFKQQHSDPLAAREPTFPMSRPIMGCSSLMQPPPPHSHTDAPLCAGADEICMRVRRDLHTRALGRRPPAVRPSTQTIGLLLSDDFKRLHCPCTLRSKDQTLEIWEEKKEFLCTNRSGGELQMFGSKLESGIQRPKRSNLSSSGRRFQALT